MLLRLAFGLIKFRAKHLIKKHGNIDVQFENEISEAFRRRVKENEQFSRFKNEARKRFRTVDDIFNPEL